MPQVMLFMFQAVINSKNLLPRKKEIGVDGRSNQKTNQAFINYSKTGTHIVPTKKGRKND